MVGVDAKIFTDQGDRGDGQQNRADDGIDPLFGDGQGDVGADDPARDCDGDQGGGDFPFNFVGFFKFDQSNDPKADRADACGSDGHLWGHSGGDHEWSDD